nr:MAG TPA: hypothetical protein [Caudoviricetes sp.]
MSCHVATSVDYAFECNHAFLEFVISGLGNGQWAEISEAVVSQGAISHYVSTCISICESREYRVDYKRNCVDGASATGSVDNNVVQTLTIRRAESGKGFQSLLVQNQHCVSFNTFIAAIGEDDFIECGVVDGFNGKVGRCINGSSLCGEDTSQMVCFTITSNDFLRNLLHKGFANAIFNYSFVVDNRKFFNFFCNFCVSSNLGLCNVGIAEFGFSGSRIFTFTSIAGIRIFDFVRYTISFAARQRQNVSLVQNVGYLFESRIDVLAIIGRENDVGRCNSHGAAFFKVFCILGSSVFCSVFLCVRFFNSVESGCRIEFSCIVTLFGYCVSSSSALVRCFDGSTERVKTFDFLVDGIDFSVDGAEFVHIVASLGSFLQLCDMVFFCFDEC